MVAAMSEMRPIVPLISLIAATDSAGGGLHLGDLAADLLGRLGGLRGKLLHFRGDDREAAAGLAGARRLDRRIEREQIGLLGDRRDQLHHVADAAGRLRQRRDARVGLFRLLHRLAGDPARLVHLPGDLVHRRCQLLGGARDRLHIGRCFLRGARHHAGKLLGGLGGLGERAGGGFELTGGGRNRVDDAADGALERVGKLMHRGLAVIGGLALVFRALLLDLAHAQALVAEQRQRIVDGADLVVAPRPGEFDIEPAVVEQFQRRGDLPRAAWTRGCAR